MKVWTVHTPPEAAARPARGGPVPPATGPAAAPGRRPPARRGRRRRRPPVVLVREGFSWLAFLFNILWLLWHRLWLAALGYLVLAVLVGALLPGGGVGFAAGLALQFLLGAHANDLRRWALARRGYAQAHVVAERDQDAALARLLAQRPDLAGLWARPAPA